MGRGQEVRWSSLSLLGLELEFLLILKDIIRAAEMSWRSKGECQNVSSKLKAGERIKG